LNAFENPQSGPKGLVRTAGHVFKEEQRNNWVSFTMTLVLECMLKGSSRNPWWLLFFARERVSDEFELKLDIAPPTVGKVLNCAVTCWDTICHIKVTRKMVSCIVNVPERVQGHSPRVSLRIQHGA
jgi:hypothetical protein